MGDIKHNNLVGIDSFKNNLLLGYLILNVKVKLYILLLVMECIYLIH